MNALDQPPENTRSARLVLRREHASDEAFLFTVYASTRAAELELTGWDQATRQAFLSMQFRAMRAGYRTTYPQAEYSIILGDHHPMGRMVVHRGGEEIRVVDLALLPEYQNRGIGTQIMQALCAEAQHSQQPVRLSVMKNSRAVRFYERLGFQCVQEMALDYQMEWRPIHQLVAKSRYQN